MFSIEIISNKNNYEDLIIKDDKLSIKEFINKYTYHNILNIIGENNSYFNEETNGYFPISLYIKNKFITNNNFLQLKKFSCWYMNFNDCRIKIKMFDTCNREIIIYNSKKINYKFNIFAYNLYNRIIINKTQLILINNIYNDIERNILYIYN